MTSTLKTRICELSKANGFDTIGFAAAHTGTENYTALQSFLAQQYHGEMDWLARDPEVRAHPTTLWPEVASVITVGLNYGPDSDPMEGLKHPDTGLISVYARNRDYHDVLKGRLKQLAGQIVSRFGGEVKVFVDTAPVMEKPLAAMTALGWQGKHTCIVSRDYGSWLFLGVIYTTLTIPPDVPEADHCGRCRACLDICPTNAFVDTRKIDARRCISYLTIEHKGHIAREFRIPMANRIYGCDDCLAICPWNKFAKTASDTAFHARDALKAPRLADLLTLDDPGFRTLFSASPIKRIGRDRFIRNVLIASGNSGDHTLLPSIEALLPDPSPLVRAMAVWAASRLHDAASFTTLKTHYVPQEQDPDVLQEWHVGAKLSV